MRFYPKDADGLSVPSTAEGATNLEFEIEGLEKARRRRRRLTTATEEEETSRRLTGTTAVTLTCSAIDCTNWAAIDADTVGCDPEGGDAKDVCGVYSEAEFDSLIGDDFFYSVKGRAVLSPTPFSRADPRGARAVLLQNAQRRRRYPRRHVGTGHHYNGLARS